MMSATKDLGPQTNPDQEQDTKSDSLSTQQPARPATVQVDGAMGDGAGARNGRNEEQSGINGVHSHHEATSATPGAATESGTKSEAKNETVEGEATEGNTAGSDGTGDDAPDTLSDVSDDALGDTPSLNDGMTTLRSAVKIKGRPGGVSLELGEGIWDELIQLLEERLNAAEGFFRGGRVVLDVGPRPLVEEQLRQVRNLLEIHEMKLGVVRSTAERTLQAAVEVGIATSEEPQEPLPEPEPPLIEPDGPPNAYAPSPYIAPAAVPTRPNHFVHRGSLRSGQVLRKTESIVVIGDVNPGAQVISSGDIMVWGRLRGVAHAGAEGNRRAVVTAIDFVPTQLRIANLTAIAPESKKARGVGLLFWKKEPERRPEIARVVDGRIVVEPWDENKPNGLGIWRK